MKVHMKIFRGNFNRNISIFHFQNYYEYMTTVTHNAQTGVNVLTHRGVGLVSMQAESWPQSHASTSSIQ